jgi:hypothetical protein
LREREPGDRCPRLQQNGLVVESIQEDLVPSIEQVEQDRSSALCAACIFSPAMPLVSTQSRG